MHVRPQVKGSVLRHLQTLKFLKGPHSEFIQKEDWVKAGVRRCMAVYGGVEQNSGGVCGCARGMGSGGGLVRRCADCAALWSTDGAMTGIRGHRTNVTEFQQCMLCVGVWRCMATTHTVRHDTVHMSLVSSH